MSHEKSSIDVSRLWDALSAPRNITALSLLAVTIVLSALIVAVFSAMGVSLMQNGHYDVAKLAGLMGGIGSMAVMLYGLNAVGLVLMAEARHLERPTMRDAILMSLATGHRLIGLVLVNVLLVLLAVLAVTLVLVLCKIPGVGPFLYTFVFPIAALLIGLLIVGQYLVVMPLAAPAIWDGHGVFDAMSRLYTLVRRKLVDVLLLELILFIMIGIVSGLIAAVLGTGVGITTALSSAVLSTGSGFSPLNLLGMLTGGMGGYNSGYMTAFAFGSSILFAFAAIIPALIAVKGFAVIFLQVSENVDFAADAAMLQAHKEAAQRKLQEAREEARRKTEQLQQQRTQAVTATPMPVAMSAQPSCPQCHALVSADDTFCGECGHRLQ
ncbi:MAG: zinc ribbon domain-containing protein [Deefgea sp.]